MNDGLYMILALLYVSAVLSLSAVALRKGFWSSEEARKGVHVLVSFSVFLIAYCISSPFLRLAGPMIFIVMNGFIGYKTGSRMTGLVLYPLSLLILTSAMNLGFLSPRSLVAASLTMGLGDGAAAVAGMRMGEHRLGRKTLEGSEAMFAVTFLVFLLSGENWSMSFMAAAVIAAAEALSPHGLDNLIVPLIAAVFAEVI